MNKTSKKLAEALKAIQKIQSRNIVGIKADELSREHKSILIKTGYIKEVLKGWYICVSPTEKNGDSTTWYVSYWGFVSRYLEARFGEDYCLSPEHSLLFHTGNRTIPNQLIVRTSKGSNLITNLLDNNSIFCMKSPLPSNSKLIKVDGLNLLPIEQCLIHCTETMYNHDPVEMRTALSMIRSSSQVLEPLIEGEHPVIAGRLVGAFRDNKQDRIANDILSVMKDSGFTVSEYNPFSSSNRIDIHGNNPNPHMVRIRLLWNEMRSSVEKVFPNTQTNSINEDTFKKIDEIYLADAYHSLSIERFKVTEDLIEKVSNDNWNPTENQDDKKFQDALAARGYWLAFNSVKESLGKIKQASDISRVSYMDHGIWYRQLFLPSVDAGIIQAKDLAGYRNSPVYISNSKHVPMSTVNVTDCMDILFELIDKEEHPGVRAVLGKFFLVYIHPYLDGNGRTGRFLMNFLLVTGGYPWTIIPVERRDEYMKSLEEASVNKNITPFAKFIKSCIQ